MKRSREPEEGEGRDGSTDTLAHPPDGVNSPESRPPAAKLTELDESALDTADSSLAMRCSLPPHREVLSFETYAEYENHYSKAHSNRCVECRKNFPTEHLLNVHFGDCHDVFAAVKREKGDHTYSCFVEGCDRKCRTPYKRRCHLIDKHMYPKNYFFAVTKDGIDGRNSLLVEGGHHRRRSSTAASATGAKVASRRQSLRQPEASKSKIEEAEPTDGPSSRDNSEEAPQTKTEVPDVEMDDLAGALSSLQFVPSSVKFGRGRGKAGFAKR